MQTNKHTCLYTQEHIITLNYKYVLTKKNASLGLYIPFADLAPKRTPRRSLFCSNQSLPLIPPPLPHHHVLVIHLPQPAFCQKKNPSQAAQRHLIIKKKIKSPQGPKDTGTGRSHDLPRAAVEMDGLVLLPLLLLAGRLCPRSKQARNYVQSKKVTAHEVAAVLTEQKNKPSFSSTTRLLHYGTHAWGGVREQSHHANLYPVALLACPRSRRVRLGRFFFLLFSSPLRRVSLPYVYVLYYKTYMTLCFV